MTSGDEVSAMHKRMSKLVWLIFSLSLLLLVTNCNNHPSNAGPKKIRVGYLPVAAELPLFVGVEQGYFQKAGIQVELTRVASSNDLATAGTADQVDILAGAASNVIFDVGVTSGKKHLLFALNPYSNTPGHITDHLIVRKNSGINSILDLKGRKIAGFPGSVRVLAFMILEKHGLPQGSYEYSELAPNNWESALQNGSIDAVIALEPTATQIIKDNAGDSILKGFYAELMPDLPLSGHWVAADFYARADKELLSAFIDAYEKAIIFCREHEREAKSYLTKYANVREDILNDVNLNPWKHYSELDISKIQSYADLLANNQAIQGRVNVSDYILPDPRQRK